MNLSKIPETMEMNQKHQILEILSFNVKYLQFEGENAVPQNFNLGLELILV